MTDAKHNSFWHRAGPLIVLTALAGAVIAEGCGDDNTTTTGSPGTTASSTSGGGGAGGEATGTGAGGTGGTIGTGGAAPIAVDKGIDAPVALDAAPSEDGSVIYFTAVGANGPGVFSAPPEGALKELAAGDPFAAPFGIAVGTDGKQLYVADPGADAGADAGAIFTLPSAGGAPTLV